MRRLILLIVAAGLAGCSPGSETASTDAVEAYAPAEEMVAAPPGEAVAEGGGEAAPGAVEVSLPQLAYRYSLGFRVPVDAVAQVQDTHVALCEKLGPRRCQLIGMERGDVESRSDGGALRLRVASDVAAEFRKALIASVAEDGGRTIATEIAAEDVSRDMVDASARIRQRELLVARLTEILRTRTGPVADLVAAERSVAEAQEELDKAKAWLAELRGRVAMSTFDIRYEAVTPDASAGALAPQLRDAITGSGAAFLLGLRSILMILIFLAPWALVIVPIVLIIRALLRRSRRATAEAAPPAASDDA
jgi:hypothetical protein